MGERLEVIDRGRPVALLVPLPAATTVGGQHLRSLDAIHLAAALSMGNHPAAFGTYDDRLATAARACDLTVISPAADSPAAPSSTARKPASAAD